MSRKFITNLEVDYINVITKQLIQNVVGQSIIYYSISVDKSEIKRLYNESVKKTVARPTEINALVKYDNTQTRSIEFGLDSKYELEVYFHNLELAERNVAPTEGDFIEYGRIFFEITSVTQPQLIFGRVDEKVMTKCICVPSREGQFQFGSDASKDKDTSHSILPVISEDI